MQNKNKILVCKTISRIINILILAQYLIRIKEKIVIKINIKIEHLIKLLITVKLRTKIFHIKSFEFHF